MRLLAIVFVAALVLPGCGPSRAGGADARPAAAPPQVMELKFPGEKHLSNIRQLTFGGENAEAYFSADGKWLVFQSTRDSARCDQIFRMRPDGTDLHLVSTGRGRTTCAYFLSDGNRILYATTHLMSPDCPPPPDRSQGYVWPLYSSYDIVSVNLDGAEVSRLTEAPGYDAEATVGPNGRIVFTSMRDGDPELYTMASDGSEPRRLTHEEGYDGGAFFSADGKQIVYRAHHPKDEEALADYRQLLAKELIRPTTLEIFVMDADGDNKRQVTNNGKANFCPFFHPDGRRIIFASNMDDPKGREFDLYLIRTDGSGLERITTSPSFDGFPMWSPDGKQLVWGSNRASGQGGYDTNIFIADWVE